jgi:hypothetical protein
MKKISLLIFLIPALSLAETFQSPPQSYSVALPNDQASNLVDELRYQSLEEMDANGLKSASLAEHPWSSTYWPLYLGLLADRYADPVFPASGDWKQNAAYIEQNLGTSVTDLLSPAEKYDLLVGDSSFTLTHSMLSEGQRYYQETGSVASWMGICHGWAPASYMMARPEHEIRVLAADGTTWINFYPSDIKGLESLLWAQGEAPIRTIGGRCNEQNPARDGLGRPSNPDCLDTNPGTWHLSVVNQIGVSKRSFIMDAEWTAQVWNQPIFSYSYSYFNPKTRQSVQALDDARVALSSFPEDRLRSVRSPAAVTLVGVNMDVTYTVETWPAQAKTDDPGHDALRTTHYQYDLEIDSTGRIIGGEWYEHDHPDFLWTPAPGAIAKSIGDKLLDRAGDRESWTGETVISPNWRAAAKRSSAEGQPLGRVVDSLLGLSRQDF